MQKRLILLFFLISNIINIIESKQAGFISDGQEELISFYTQENINSDKQIKRNGVLIKRPNARANILICHGFMCDKFDVSFLHLLFKEYNTMTFDFRAHGTEIEDQICTFGRDESFDVLGATQFIKNHSEIKDLPLIIYGFSMGAVSSIIAGELDRKLCNAMILDCPFESSDKLLDRGLSQFKINFFGLEMNIPGSGMLKNYAYSPYVQSLLKMILKTFAKMDSSQVNTCIGPVYPEEAIKYITVPVFLIGCINDDKAPVEAVRAVYEGAQGYKRLWVCDARRHYDPIFYRMHEYIYRVNKFIKDILNKTIFDKQKEKVIKSF